MSVHSVALPAECLTPAGRCLLVRFDSLSDLLGVFPYISVSALTSLATIHHIPFSQRWRKNHFLADVARHVCTDRCDNYRVFVFKQRRRTRTSGLSNTRAVYTLVDSEDVRTWKTDGVDYITSELLRRQYRIASETVSSLLVRASLTSLMVMFSLSSEDVDLLMGIHTIACGSSASLQDKKQLL